MGVQKERSDNGLEAGSQRTMAGPYTVSDPTSDRPSQTASRNPTIQHDSVVNSNNITPHDNEKPPLETIPSISRLRFADESFVISVDTEFFYDDRGQLTVLSWQFSWIDPTDTSLVRQCIIFPGGGKKLLSLQTFISYIVEKFSLYKLFKEKKKEFLINNGVKFNDLEDDNVEGATFFSCRRWIVPVKQNDDEIKNKEYKSFTNAIKKCCDNKLVEKLLEHPDARSFQLPISDSCAKHIKPLPNSKKCFYPNFNGYPLGFIYNFKDAEIYAIPITFLCHFGRADWGQFYTNQNDVFETDLMRRLHSIQKGLVTLSPFFWHTRVCSKRDNFYPLKIRVRDTMCFAPADKKSLAALGKVVGCEKISIAYDKDKMNIFRDEKIVDFAEYAIQDTFVALKYSSELWGRNRDMPITVSAAAGRLARRVIEDIYDLDDKTFNEFFVGIKEVRKGLIYDNVLGYMNNMRYEFLNNDAENFTVECRNAYKGGYNGSCRIGYYNNFMTYDFDLENAYPTAMSMIADVDWKSPIYKKYENITISSEDISKIIPDPCTPAVGYVDFEFPKTCLYPCIPMNIDGCIVYPLSNKGCNSAYIVGCELYLALKLGARIDVKMIKIANKLNFNGNISHSLYHVVKSLVNDRNEAKNIFGKNSLAEQLLKTAVCSIYGKTAQDVVEKRAWDAWSQDMSDLSGSKITSPYHASATTAIIRCALIAAMNQLEEKGYRCFSVTTDGFISDAPFDVLKSLDLYGFTEIFMRARRSLVGENAEMWACKHQQSDLLNLTTRGNVSSEDGGVLAHNSYRSEYKKGSMEDRLDFIHVTLSRTGPVKSYNQSFTGFKEMSAANNRQGFYQIENVRNLSMDFDLKRKPVRDSFTTVYPEVEGKKYEIANFETKPYETIAEYEEYKRISKENKRALRTEKDWQFFYMHLDNNSKGGASRRIKDPDWSILFSCIMAYRQRIVIERNNFESLPINFLEQKYVSVKEKCEWINIFNKSEKKFKESDWKNARKQNRLGQLLPEDMWIDLYMKMVRDSPQVVYGTNLLKSLAEYRSLFAAGRPVPAWEKMRKKNFIAEDEQRYLDEIAEEDFFDDFDDDYTQYEQDSYEFQQSCGNIHKTLAMLRSKL